MISYKNGNVFEQGADMVIHQANCQCRMGSGIAKTIAAEYPEAVMADKYTSEADLNKLGTFSWAKCKKGNVVIFNMYSQFMYGSDSRKTNYIHMARALWEIKKHIMNYYNDSQRVCIPHLIGCGLAGGDWNVVKALLEDAFEDFGNNSVTVCKLI
jgi:O-acetyl-ADP-ribose deacetylase (regulator of RNase III)